MSIIQTNSKDKVYAVRFHLFNGETLALKCSSANTCREIKDRIWKKKSLTAKQSDHVFGTWNGEIIFEDDDETFDKLFDASLLFEEVRASSAKSLVELSLLKKSQLRDSEGRSSKIINPDLPILKKGVLGKLGSGKTKTWKDRFFVIQGFTLYYYGSEAEFQKRQPAHDFIPLGSCDAVPMTGLDDAGKKSRDFVFELRANHVGRRVYTLSAPSAPELKEWIDAFQKLIVRRTKAVLFLSCKELLRRGAAQEGLFRKSGSSNEIKTLKQSCDLGHFPDFSKVADEHCLTGIIKLCLREMPIPLLTFELYEEFIQIVDVFVLQKQLNQLSTLVGRLPPSHLSLANYFFNFLVQVSDDKKENQMSATNLAIVIAPNILRPTTQTLQTTISHTRNVLVAVQLMIEQYATVFHGQELQQDRYASSGLSTVNGRIRLSCAPLPLPPSSSAHSVAKQQIFFSVSSANHNQEEVDEWAKRLQATVNDWDMAFEDRKAALARHWTSLFTQLGSGEITPEMKAGVEALFDNEDKWRFAVLKKIDKETSVIADLKDRYQALMKERAEAQRIIDEQKEKERKIQEEQATKAAAEDAAAAAAAVAAAAAMAAAAPPLPGSMPPGFGGPDPNPRNERGTSVAPPSADLRPKEIWCVALFDLRPDDEDCDDELSFDEGEKVLVLDNSDSEGWWQGQKQDGRIGLFPYNFVRLLDASEI